MTKDALGAHAHDELAIIEMTTARPIQAALVSAATFTCGAAFPLLIVFVVPMGLLVPIEAGAQREAEHKGPGEAVPEFGADLAVSPNPARTLPATCVVITRDPCSGRW